MRKAGVSSLWVKSDNQPGRGGKEVSARNSRKQRIVLAGIGLEGAVRHAAPRQVFGFRGEYGRKAET